MGTDINQPRGVGPDSTGRRELKEPAVDTAYLFDNAVTSAKVGPSVDLEFVRSNDNTIAGDINAKVDGAYNLGSSTNQFDTIYANNFPGAGGGGATLSTKTGNLSGVKGVKLRADGDMIGAVFKEPPNKGNQGSFWIRQYSSKAAFEAINSDYTTLPQSFGSSNTPVVSLGNATINPEGKTNLFSVSLVPEGTWIGGFAPPESYDLTWDGTYLWTVSQNPAYLYKFKTDGTCVKTVALSTTYPNGLTWDGTYLWYSDEVALYVYQLKTDGTQTGNGFVPPGNSPFGLAWDGKYLWHVDSGADDLICLKTDGTQIKSYSTPGPYPAG